MTKLRCVRYKDAFSAKGSSYQDLLIGTEHRVVGCNSKVFGSSKSGDYVIVVANDGPHLYFTVGCLTERLYDCHLWADEGGRIWEHNFMYTPLLPGIYERTRELTARVETLCKAALIDPAYLFHSRFCGVRYAPVLHTLIVELKDTVPAVALSKDLAPASH